MKKILVYLLLVSPLLAATLPFTSKAAYDVASAKSYLAAKSQNAWTTMGLVALGENNPNLEHLKSVAGGQAIAYAAPILALTAAGKNPATFGNEDYVAKLKSYYSQGQIGDPVSLNDDIFGVLALISAGEAKNSSAISGTKDYILGHQAANGGWSYATGAPGDADMTAAAILALLAAGTDKQNAQIQTALTFLKTNQTEDGGFLSSPAFDTAANTSSTAWVVWTLNALGISPSSWNKGENNPITYLENAQNSEGWFAYQTATTEDGFTPVTSAYALIALSGKSLPIKTFSAEPLQSFDFRIEGKNETVCEGQVQAINALEIVKNASEQCGYAYTIQDTQYGPYLSQIGSDAGESLSGWQYAVNLTLPSIGAADYMLKTNDQVLWYYGSWDDKLTRLALDQTSITSGQSVVATLEYQNSGVWQPLEGASVSVGSTNISTNGNGQATLNGSDGYYRVVAKKPGYVRSNSILLKIGEPQNSNVSLSVNIPGVNGEETPPPTKPEIAFSINPGVLDFGDLSAGQHLEKTLTFNNTGSKDLNMQSVVEGDEVFIDNLKLQNQPWSQYQGQVNSGEQTSVPAQLSIPASFPGYGRKQGQIIFWAQAK